MNNLDDLLRESLQEHTPATDPDDTLAEKVEAAGRRIRRTRVAGATALAIVALAGVVWGSTTIPGLTGPGVIAATPSPVSTSGTPTPTPSEPTPSGPATTEQTPTFSPGGTVRDVTKVGAETGYPTSYLESYFASPSGNFLCTISTEDAHCTGTWDKGVEPTRKICDVDEVVEGVRVTGSKPAAWYCGSDAQSFPFLSGTDGGTDGIAWWDSTFGESIPNPADPSVKMAVLPYGKTLISGDYRCTMEKSGVNCINTRTGQGFITRRAGVDFYKRSA